MSKVSLDLAKALIAEGLSQKDAAFRIGVTQATLSRFCKTHDLKFKHGLTRDPGAREMRMAALYRNGYTLQQIGDLYGVTRERVRQLITKHYGMRAPDGGLAEQARKKSEAKDRARNAKYLRKYGCTVEQYESLRQVGRQMIATGYGEYRTPLRAYATQKSSAKHRGIEWKLTLWEWWAIWKTSGKWEQRGRGDGYVMCRIGDVGPYSPENVFIDLATENLSKRSNRKTDLPTGVSERNGRYRAMRDRVYLGTFATPDLAHAAYLAAAFAPSQQRAAS